MKSIDPLRKKELCFSAIFGIVTMHLLALIPLWFSSTSGWILCIFFFCFTAWVGITLCYHRLLTHDSFKTPQWFRYVLTIIGTLAWQGGPITWVGNHRIHHQYSDTENDPHSPSHGFNWSHIFWMFYKFPEGKDPKLSAKDLARDKGILLIERYFWLPQVILSFVLLVVGYLFGGIELALSWIGWVIGVRTIAVYHSTWFVNSASHTWGYRNFNTKDTSTNLWWVALLAGGEGWHNNHHAKPNLANHGRRFWEIDVTYYMIKALSFVKLASDIRIGPRLKATNNAF